MDPIQKMIGGGSDVELLAWRWLVVVLLSLILYSVWPCGEVSRGLLKLGDDAGRHFNNPQGVKK